MDKDNQYNNWLHYLWIACDASGNACQACKTGDPWQIGIATASVYPTSKTSPVSIAKVDKLTKWEGTTRRDATA